LFTFIGAENDVLAPEVDSLADNLPYVILLVLRSVVVFVLWKRKRSTATDPNIISLGKFNFNKRESELVLEEQRIELTSKEADLLLLLLEAVNTTVERETILNLVWGDEGDYVGRTLDVFISKLRKKLEADPSIKIVNARSVGYKLMTD
jgi:DNA-binding response OmpR family regulator